MLKEFILPVGQEQFTPIANYIKLLSHFLHIFAVRHFSQYPIWHSKQLYPL